ncbi:MAG: hypothetical protein H6Q67_2287 [Firmicutes bacterium]|nr:hypothetical protein [Bacillota bacterium]
MGKENIYIRSGIITKSSRYLSISRTQEGIAFQQMLMGLKTAGSKKYKECV